MHLAASSLLFGLAAAASHRIDVGKSGLTFSPNTTTAAIGDTLEFHFYPKKHSVAMGPFASPCQASKTGGFFSGYVPVDSGESKVTFSVKVNSTDPIWFYCTQGTHCSSGMVGVVNPSKTGANTLAAYAAAAKGVAAAEAPANVFGGALSNGGAAASGSASASPSATSTKGSATASKTSSATGSASATSSVKPGAAARLGGGAEMGGLVAGVAIALAVL